ncbi:MAG TPA: hypothetical protein DCM61_04055 [Clostridiales bacterium]|nr:hypothetical protein [Clostridiales bacterium]
MWHNRRRGRKNTPPDWRRKVAEEKSSTYRGFTEAQARAHKKYIAQFVETKVRMTPERREQIKAHAEARGESVNAFINRAIDEAMEREGQA